MVKKALAYAKTDVGRGSVRFIGNEGADLDIAMMPEDAMAYGGYEWVDDGEGRISAKVQVRCTELLSILKQRMLEALQKENIWLKLHPQKWSPLAH